MVGRVSRRGKRKTVQFRGMIVWIIVFYTFTTSFYPYAFYNKRLHTLFKDQLEVPLKHKLKLFETFLFGENKTNMSYKITGEIGSCHARGNLQVTSSRQSPRREYIHI